MTPRRLIILGALIAAGAVLLAGLGAAIPGPRPPDCIGRPLAEDCRSGAVLLGLALQSLALLVALVGGTLVAIGLGRRAGIEDERF